MKEDRLLTFGKYKGETIKYILLTHIGYIMWCLENIDWFYLTDEEQSIYDAIAIMVKKYDIETTFPKDTLYKHVKNSKSMEELSTPFFMRYDGMICCHSKYFNNHIVKSVSNYISEIEKNPSQIDILCGLSHSLSKDVEAARLNGEADEDIFGGWKDEFGHC